jgi:Bacterial SH3 domain
MVISSNVCIRNDDVREGAGVDYSITHYGMPGDTVHFLNRDGNPKELMVEEDVNGVSWYQVGFPDSGAYGWVRRDFVRQTECR